MARVALLIDGENIAAEHFAEIIEYVTALGRVRIAQVFADFSGGRHAGWLQHAGLHGLRPMLQVSGGKGKNSTDIAIAIAAMDILHGGNVDVLALVSTDRDFMPLALRLREGGLRVLGLGLRTPEMALASCCDDYHVLGVANRPAILPPLVITPEERAFVLDLLAELSRDGPFSPAILGKALHARNEGLASRIGGSGLLKRLRRLDLVTEFGNGSALKIAPRQTARIRAA
jgi:uncharacterized protein (TIGR00288 family)